MTIRRKINVSWDCLRWNGSSQDLASLRFPPNVDMLSAPTFLDAHFISLIQKLITNKQCRRSFTKQPLAAMRCCNADGAASRHIYISKWLSLLNTSETWNWQQLQQSYDTCLQEWLPNQMIVFWSNVSWKKIHPVTPELLRKSSCGSLCRAFAPLWSLKTMGDRVCIAARSKICRMTHLVSGPASKGSAIDVCGWSMNHFNGRSVAFPPGPPPKCSRISSQAGSQAGEQIAQKAEMARTGPTFKSFSLSRAKKMLGDQWDRWQLDNLLNRGTLVVLSQQLTRRENQFPRFANPFLKAPQLFPPHHYFFTWPRFPKWK